MSSSPRDVAAHAVVPPCTRNYVATPNVKDQVPRPRAPLEVTNTFIPGLPPKKKIRRFVPPIRVALQTQIVPPSIAVQLEVAPAPVDSAAVRPGSPERVVVETDGVPYRGDDASLLATPKTKGQHQHVPRLTAAQVNKPSRRPKSSFVAPSRMARPLALALEPAKTAQQRAEPSPSLSVDQAKKDHASDELPQEPAMLESSKVDHDSKEAELSDDEVLVVRKKSIAPARRFRAPGQPTNSTGRAVTYIPHKPLALTAGVMVPSLICQFLRPHQREGVKFLFDCVTGRRKYPDSVVSGSGAILADGMGLGKTLQTIALVYTLLRFGDSGKPIRRCIVTCPCSLVGNWENEFDKWINTRASNKSERVEVKGLNEGSKQANEVALEKFLAPSRPFHVLVVSYETLRANIDRLARQKINGCDLLVADEAQRLKGAKTMVNLALASLPCPRRVLLTGTPLQNDLAEFRAMADIANPGTLGTVEQFNKRFTQPILEAREPDAPSDVKELGGIRQTELANLAKCFVLRRENRLNALHLPPKLELVVCCRMPAVQRIAYEQTLNDKQLQHALQGKQTDCFAYIDKLLKVCNHPLLLGRPGVAEDKKSSLMAASAKMCVLYRLMREMRRRNDGERIVVVANATASLELVSKLCDSEGWPWCLLDGKTPIKKRKQLNVEFNDPSSHHFAFLLSSTAGGCG